MEIPRKLGKKRGNEQTKTNLGRARSVKARVHNTTALVFILQGNSPELPAHNVVVRVPECLRPRLAAVRLRELRRDAHVAQGLCEQGVVRVVELELVCSLVRTPDALEAEGRCRSA